MNTKKLLKTLLAAVLLITLSVTAVGATIVLLPTDEGLEIVRPEGAGGNFAVMMEGEIGDLRQMRAGDAVTWPLTAAPGTYRVTIYASKQGDDRDLPFNYVIKSGTTVLLEAPIQLTPEDVLLNSWNHYVEYVLGEITIAAGMNTLTLTNVQGDIRIGTNWPRIRSITLEPVGGAAPAATAPTPPAQQAAPTPAPTPPAGTAPAAAPQTNDATALAAVILLAVAAGAVLTVKKVRVK